MDAFSTHQRSLIVAINNTAGPVIELGAGWYSTPILHEMCKATGRHLTTIDDSDAWVSQFEWMASDIHKIEHVDLWENAKFDMPRYGLAFIDHAPAHRRREEILRLFDICDVFVAHDWEDQESYCYNLLEGVFEFVAIDNLHETKTAILSSKVDVTKWLT